MRRVPSVHDSSPLPQIFSVSPGEKEEYLQSAANRLFHPPHQGGIRRLLTGITDSSLLLSHGISTAARQRLVAGDSAAFLKLRAEWMRPRVQSFFDRHVRWDEPDRPSIASLIIDDEAG
jgi:hypothetical protein